MQFTWKCTVCQTHFRMNGFARRLVWHRCKMTLVLNSQNSHGQFEFKCKTIIYRLIVKTTCRRSLKVNQTRVVTAIHVNENFKILVLQDRTTPSEKIELYFSFYFRIYAELGHFTLLLWRGKQRNAEDYNHNRIIQLKELIKI